MGRKTASVNIKFVFKWLEMMTDAHFCDLESTVQDMKRKLTDIQVKYSMKLPYSDLFYEYALTMVSIKINFDFRRNYWSKFSKVIGISISTVGRLNKVFDK
jgi:hypothetical protein